MAKQRKTTLILGEGPTEFYYFNSLSDRFKGLNIKPDNPKHTNIKQLEQKIKEGISMGYDYIYCVIDMDTKDIHRCTELFFLYYFKYTSRMYEGQEPLLRDLNQHCEYRKTIDFFIKSKGLHSYFEKKGGSLDKAIANAERSMQDKEAGNRDFTYTELGKLMDELKALQA